MSCPTRCFLWLILAVVLPLRSSAATPPVVELKAKPPIGSTIFKWEEMPTRSTPLGERRTIADNPTSTLEVFECHVSTLNPGQAAHPPHRHPQEELIIVKEGRLEVFVNGRTELAGPGSTFFYASTDPHAVRNLTQDRATYFVINLATAATLKTSLATEPVLDSNVFNWENLKTRKTPNGERRDILNGRTKTLINLESYAITLNPGDVADAPHRHLDEEVVIVREGTLEVNLNGQMHVVGTGAVLFFGSKDLHGLRNPGIAPAIFHVIRIVTAATPNESHSK